MGQYFKAVNLDKREVVCPWCLHGGAKLWEWAANPYGALFTLLLRKSSCGGGGDYYGYQQQEFDISGEQSFAEAITSVMSQEGKRISEADDTIVGRWAGDRVVLVGDYDDSEIWDTSRKFRNVTQDVVEAWNAFIDVDDRKLEYNPTCGCRSDSD